MKTEFNLLKIKRIITGKNPLSKERERNFTRNSFSLFGEFRAAKKLPNNLF